MGDYQRLMYTGRYNYCLREHLVHFLRLAIGKGSEPQHLFNHDAVVFRYEYPQHLTGHSVISATGAILVQYNLRTSNTSQ